MAAPVPGVSPTFPLMTPPPVVVIVAPARIVKCATDLKLTGAGPAASNVRGVAIKTAARTRPMRICFVPLVLSVRGS